MKTLYDKIKNLPDTSGVYFFKRGKEILYIGKATNLRSRVGSYFAGDIADKRGPLIGQMLELADGVEYKETDSVLEALILEANLIKKHKPKYNTKEKDDKSHNFIIITEEDFPRVLVARERDLLVAWLKNDDESSNRGMTVFPPSACVSCWTPASLAPSRSERVTKQSFRGSHKSQLKYVFGPYPQGAILRDALKIIRKIFPFRDKCVPYVSKPCFNRQIGLCPGVCTGEIDKREYGKIIANIKLLLEGKKSTIVGKLKREMSVASKKKEFERAGIIRDQIFALEHIQDVALLKRNVFSSRERGNNGEGGNFARIRIEAYDVAHLSGEAMVGAMTVVDGGEVAKGEYRKFKIKSVEGINDIASLQEIIKRRVIHGEWSLPDIVVVDGGAAQLSAAEKIISDLENWKKKGVEVVAVVKDERHKPKAIFGKKEIIKRYKNDILLANSEAHRFSLSAHRGMMRKRSFPNG